jgi:hypothetical protein
VREVGIAVFAIRKRELVSAVVRPHAPSSAVAALEQLLREARKVCRQPATMKSALRQIGCWSIRG